MDMLDMLTAEFKSETWAFNLGDKVKVGDDSETMRVVVVQYILESEKYKFGCVPDRLTDYDVNESGADIKFFEEHELVRV